MTYIIGISTMGSSSACLIHNGSIIFAIEEERLSRIKNDSSFPYLSIKACLDYKNLNINDIHTIAIYWDRFELLPRIFSSIKLLLVSLFNFSSPIRLINLILFKVFGLRDSVQEGSWIDLFFVRKLLRKKFGKFDGKIMYFNHHLCHVVSALAVSDKSDSTCLVIDGGGESTSTEQYLIRSGNIIKQFSIKWPNSLGHYYSFFTGFLGFKMLEGEYKMMGLSPFGKPSYADVIKENFLQLTSNAYKFKYSIASYHSALSNYFNDKVISLLGNPRQPSDIFNDKHLDIAASVQLVYEDTLIHLLNKNHNNDDSLLLAGGCALNVSANGKIIENKIYKKLYIPPCPHDAGAAVGAAILASSKIHNKPLIDYTFDSPYLGPLYQDKDILLAINSSELTYTKFNDFNELAFVVASKLDNKCIISWFQGRSEFGPRALGNRSLLADPRSASIRDIINEKVKQRELFRPFAPSCKIEVANKYFAISQDSPYMNIAAQVLPEVRNLIPAVTHIDGTARVHTVDKSINNRYWTLIDYFEKITGIGVLLNTSFNIQEPIVETPQNAVSCFLKSGIDYLVIGDYLVQRYGNR